MVQIHQEFTDQQLSE